MSRIGKQPIPIPTGVTVSQQGQTVQAKGPKGQLAHTVPTLLSVRVNEGAITVGRSNDEKATKALHGLYRALLANAVHGVSTGFQKELEMNGVGYRAQTQGKALTLTVGFSHPVTLPIPEGVSVKTPKPTQIIVEGFDRHAVGQFAATVRRVAPPEPYKGKGIQYAGELIRRKAGKAATGAKSGAGQ